MKLKAIKLFLINIVKICLMTKTKFLARKFFLLQFYFATIISVHSKLFMRKGKGSGAETGCGSVTTGSGSGRPKNITYIFSKKSFVLQFYFATIISVHSTLFL
jgi:hypothetical protein